MDGVYFVITNLNKSIVMNNKKQQIVVVKLGTSVLTGGTKQLDRARIVDATRDNYAVNQLIIRCVAYFYI